MPVKTQKEFFIYSIQHTGTHFVRDLIMTFTTPEKVCLTAQYRKLPPTQREQYMLKEHIKLFYSSTPKNKLHKADLIGFFAHHMNPKSKLIKNITINKPSLPIVIPMRDPLLTANTFLFWYNKRDPKWRQQHIKKITLLFMEILSVPDTHRRLFPVDLYNTENLEERIKRSKSLFEFCKLDWNSRTQNFVTKWRPAHETQQVTQRAIQDKTFLKNKSAIINKNTEALKVTMDIELSYLQRQDSLKQKMLDYGYKDLAWW